MNYRASHFSRVSLTLGRQKKPPIIIANYAMPDDARHDSADSAIFSRQATKIGKSFLFCPQVCPALYFIRADYVHEIISGHHDKRA